MAPKPRFVDGEKVLCYHGPLLYEAKCLQSQIENKQMKYFIHYSGWNKNWDEWVSECRILKYTDLNIQKQKELSQTYAGSKKYKGPKVKKEKEEEKEISMEKTPTETQIQLTHTYAGIKKSKSPRIKKEKEEEKVASFETAKKTPAEKSKPILTEKSKTLAEKEKPSAAEKIEQLPADKAKKSIPEKPKSVPAEKQQAVKRKNPACIPENISLNNPLKVLKENLKIERPFLEEFQPVKKIKINLPQMMKDWLIDDQDVIKRQKRILHLPARITVDHITAGFLREKVSVKRMAKNQETDIVKFSHEMRMFFNAALGKCVLYRFERTQYADILAENPGKKMSEIYGAIHLVRLISKIEEMLQVVPINGKQLDDFLVQVDDFIQYISRNPEFFKITDYDVATPAYCRRAL